MYEFIKLHIFIYSFPFIYGFHIDYKNFKVSLLFPIRLEILR